MNIVVGKKWDKGAVYIGRGSPLGNPFVMRDKSDAERNRVIKLYRIWIKIQLNKNNNIIVKEIQRLRALAKKSRCLTLGCYCSPKKCHGDVIKDILLKKREKSVLKVATAFSGGLAACEFALRYENIPHKVVFACENDKYARLQYLEFHKEPGRFFEDIKDLKAGKYKNKIDLFVWGSPCQDLSIAGKRKGFDGDKSSLFREGARVMEEMMPEIFIFENVKGLLSSNSGNDYREVLSTFRKMGYFTKCAILNTKDFGVPQNRERVFIVGFLDKEKYNSFHFPKKKPLKLSLKHLLEKDVDKKYYLSKKQIDIFTDNHKKHIKRKNGFKFIVKSGNDVAYCISTKSGSRITDNYIEIKLNQIGNLNKYKNNSMSDRVYSPHGTSVCLKANGGGGGVKTGLYKVKKGIRRLTPTECFRLQGVHKGDIHLINSDTQSYKIAGNAISVNVIQSIISKLYKNKKG